MVRTAAGRVCSGFDLVYVGQRRMYRLQNMRGGWRQDPLHQDCEYGVQRTVHSWHDLVCVGKHSM